MQPFFPLCAAARFAVCRFPVVLALPVSAGSRPAVAVASFAIYSQTHGKRNNFFEKFLSRLRSFFCAVRGCAAAGIWTYDKG